MYVACARPLYYLNVLKPSGDVSGECVVAVMSCITLTVTDPWNLCDDDPPL